MEAESKKQGVPVMGDCKRCSEHGYGRILSTEVHHAVEEITDAISPNTWKKTSKPFYDQLIGKLKMEVS